MGKVSDSRILKKLEENLLISKTDDRVIGEAEAKDWAMGIKTYRYFGERFLDLEELKRDEESEESENKENENSQLTQEKQINVVEFQSDEEKFMANNGATKDVYKSRKNLLNYLSLVKKIRPRPLKILEISVLGSFLIFLLLYFIGYFVVGDQFKANIKNYSLINWSNQRVAETQLILLGITELWLREKKIYN